MDVEFEFKEKNGALVWTKLLAPGRLQWYRKVWADFR